MALVLKDRVRETSTSTGTGAFTLDGAVAGFQSFSAIGTGNQTYYTIVNGTTQWEVGIGIWTSPNQLTRFGILASSTGLGFVNFTAGTKDVFSTFPAEGFGQPPPIGLQGPNTINGTTITGTTLIGSQIRSYGRVTVDDTGVSGYTAELGVDANGYAVIGGAYSVGGPINEAVLAPAGLALGDSNTAIVLLSAAPTSTYGLNFPPAAGSNNQLLKTDGAGNLGWMDLGSPPAIGGTTPNTITGTTVTATTAINLPAVVNTGTTTGIMQMVDGGDGYDYLKIYTWDGSSEYGIYIPQIYGLTSLSVNGNILGLQIFVKGDGTYSGLLQINRFDNATSVKLTVPTTLSTNYTLTLPTTAGSANQVLKTDGSGNLSWVNLNAPSIYTTASSQSSTSTTLADITGLTATLTANTTYRVDCFVTFQSAATTTGINFGFTSPTGTTCMLEVVVPITNTAAASQLRTIFPNNSSTNTGSVLGTGVSTINNNHTARFSGIIKVGGTGGTFAAQYATEVAASAITIPAGSTMVIQQIS